LERDFLAELKWRGMIHDLTPGTEEELKKGMTAAYIGFDPTADSLHIGNLVPIMLLVHFQRCGHKPYVLVGGATGMIGDPSGKSEERNLLDEETITHNLECQKGQLQRFLNFTEGPNKAELVNNYDWFRNINFLDFLRDTGKHISVNYMMAKESVKKRLETGISFTEFSYQLVQGYDFYWLYAHHNCKLQMGGSDQWGNMVTGTELIRRKSGGEAFALTTPLITKSDGSKFGKSEGGNVWLDAKRTSPYKFYQYWINTSDEDAKRYIRTFTLLYQEEIEALEQAHDAAPHERKLQKQLAQSLMETVHGHDEFENAVAASDILFGKGTREMLSRLNEDTLLAVFEGVPQSNVERSALHTGIDIIEFLVNTTQVFSSNGEARRMIQANAVSINKEKVALDRQVVAADLLDNAYIIVQKGKKNYHLIKTT
jgi:tyrosyl-tRNA synthetase